MTQNRKSYLDILRVISILFVIFHHTGDRGYLLFTMDCSIYLRIIYVATAGIIETAVPIFFIISGALLINKEESLKDLYRKRVLKIFLVLVVFSIIQYLYQVIFYGQVLSVKLFIKYMFSCDILIAYWYLYAYLVYLVCLPFIRKLALNMSNKEFKYLFIVFLSLEGLISGIAFGMNWSLTAFLAIPFCNRVIIYPLIGYYMENRMEEEQFNSKGVLKFILCMVVALTYIVVMTIMHEATPEEIASLSHGLIDTGFTMVLAAGIYYILKTVCIKKKMSLGGEKVFKFLGGTVFGIYLLEYIIRDRTAFICDYISEYVGCFLGAWIWVIVVFVIGAVVVGILKLIPFVKKVI